MRVRGVANVEVTRATQRVHIGNCGGPPACSDFLLGSTLFGQKLPHFANDFIFFVLAASTIKQVARS